MCVTHILLVKITHIIFEKDFFLFIIIRFETLTIAYISEYFERQPYFTCYIIGKVSKNDVSQISTQFAWIGIAQLMKCKICRPTRMVHKTMIKEFE